MVEPITWRLAEDLKVLVMQITIANEFMTDLGAGVILLDRSQIKLDGQPVTIITISEFTTDEQASSKRAIHSDVELSLEFAMPFEAADTELMVHRAAADLRRVLTGDLRGRALNFRYLRIGSTTFATDLDDAGDLFTLAQVTARAGLTEILAPAL